MSQGKFLVGIGLGRKVYPIPEDMPYGIRWDFYGTEMPLVVTFVLNGG